MKPLKATRKVNIVKSVGIGVLLDLFWLFGILPAFGYPEPQPLQVLGIVVFDQIVGLSIMFVSSIDWSDRINRIRR